MLIKPALALSAKKSVRTSLGVAFIPECFMESPDIREVNVQQSLDKCESCGNDKLLRLYSLNLKICTDCCIYIYWPKEKATDRRLQNEFGNRYKTGVNH
jgi:hypothetical protein